MTRSPLALATAIAASSLIGGGAIAATAVPPLPAVPKAAYGDAATLVQVQMNLGDVIGNVIKEVEKGNIRIDQGRIELKGDAASMVRNITRQRSGEDRARTAQEVLSIPAPENRDLAAILSAVPAALLGSGTAASELPEEELLTYRNCPPGLAKLDPPCVPPGLAKQGVTYEQWVSYGPDDYENMLEARRDAVSPLAPSVSALPPVEPQLASIDPLTRDNLPAALRDDNARRGLNDTRTQPAPTERAAVEETVKPVEPAPVVKEETVAAPTETNLLLTSEEIADLYSLRPAPSGRHYALIDGMPVLLDDKDYTSLSRINDLAQAAPLGEGVQVAPTAALTQSELMSTYKLSAPQPGYKYSVLNGELIMLEDRSFETLQLIRIARAAL